MRRATSASSPLHADRRDEHHIADDAVGMLVTDRGERNVRNLFVLIAGGRIALAANETIDEILVSPGIGHRLDRQMPKHAGDVNQLGMRIPSRVFVRIE